MRYKFLALSCLHFDTSLQSTAEYWTSYVVLLLKKKRESARDARERRERVREEEEEEEEEGLGSGTQG